MSTTAELIKDSMSVLGILPAESTPAAVDVKDGLRILNRMLDSWSTERLTVYAQTKETFTLSAGTASYTWGSGGAFATSRPFKVEEQPYLHESGSTVDLPVRLITQAEYDAIGDKTLQGRPIYLLFDPQYPLAKVYMWPVPDKTYALYLNSWKALTQIATISTEVDFPPGYSEAIVYNLAIRIAPAFGRSVMPEVAVIAERSLNNIKSVNQQLPKVQLDVPGCYGGRPNIYSGGYL